MKMMERKSVWILMGVVVAAVVLVGVIFTDARRPNDVAGTSGSPALSPSGTEGTSARADIATPAAPEGDMRVLDDAVTGLEGGGDSRAILAKLRGYLLGLPKGVASELIRKFLDGKRDAGTRLEFAVERNGFLAGAPSLRVFLLDMLAQVDPAGAGEDAKVILGSADSPDE
jgi:hypothetical protein